MRKFALVTFLALLPCGVLAANEDRAALVSELQRGGFVIYFRHADTGPATPEPPTVVLGRCETQRNLNENGRAQARAIGGAFQALRIPVGKVLSSQFCRCWQTADLAFGRHEVMQGLTGVRRGPEFEAARNAASGVLRTLLATSPAAGQNTVLVSHGFNLIDLEGLYLDTQGEAAVFRPLQSGGYRLVARVLPDEWNVLAQATRAPSQTALHAGPFAPVGGLDRALARAYSFSSIARRQVP
jgi:broad specificity phosphatase PhoE